MFDEKEQPLDRRSLISRGGALLGTCLLASATGPLQAKEPQKYIPQPYFDVKAYGATGNRADNATKAFRDAIDACNARGGGTVNVPPGDFTVGRVELKDNVTLHLEAGATLFLSQLKDDFGGGGRAMIFAENRKIWQVLVKAHWTDWRNTTILKCRDLMSTSARKLRLQKKRAWICADTTGRKPH